MDQHSQCNVQGLAEDLHMSSHLQIKILIITLFKILFKQNLTETNSINLKNDDENCIHTASFGYAIITKAI